MEIFSRPDEWGTFDYQLAQQLLMERGFEVTPKNTSIKSPAI
jgi:hypothetical protein